jgi:hypothetical protein
MVFGCSRRSWLVRGRAEVWCLRVVDLHARHRMMIVRMTAAFGGRVRPMQ